MIDNKGLNYFLITDEDREEMEIPEKVSKVEAIIYDWVATNYGPAEAQEGSWNINQLAEYVEQNIDTDYKQKYTVQYRD